MDLSQLPKMSETPKPPPTPVEETSASVPHRTPVPGDYGHQSGGAAMGGVSVLISGVVGIIFLYFGMNFARWAIATLSGHDFPTGWLWEEGTPKAGLPRTYFELIGGTAWSECAFFVMGVALLLDAALILAVYQSRRPRLGLVRVALVVTALALAMNAIVSAYLFQFFLPIAQLVAVITGGIMLFDQLAILRERR